MATYSNVPAVSGTVYNITRSDVTSGGFTLNGTTGVRYLLLYTVPANSYAVIKTGVKYITGSGNTRAGLTVIDPGAFSTDSSADSRKKVNYATCFSWASDVTGDSQDEDSRESIYLGPGHLVYAVAAGNSLSPSGTFEFHISGVQFTNGL